jgi:hypothetical protein
MLVFQAGGGGRLRQTRRGRGNRHPLTAKSKSETDKLRPVRSVRADDRLKDRSVVCGSQLMSHTETDPPGGPGYARGGISHFRLGSAVIAAAARNARSLA